MDQTIKSRQLRVETPLRCDYDHLVIQKGKYATQVIGDPELVKAQGIYHGRNCYQAALATYNEKKEELDMQEEADGS